MESVLCLSKIVPICYSSNYNKSRRDEEKVSPIASFLFGRKQVNKPAKKRAYLEYLFMGYR